MSDRTFSVCPNSRAACHQAKSPHRFSTAQGHIRLVCTKLTAEVDVRLVELRTLRGVDWRNTRVSSAADTAFSLVHGPLSKVHSTNDGDIVLPSSSSTTTGGS
jgi:hypothetical protein